MRDIELIEIPDLEKSCYCECQTPNLLHDISEDEVLALFPKKEKPQLTFQNFKNNPTVNNIHLPEKKTKLENGNSVLKIDYGYPNRYRSFKTNSSELLLDNLTLKANNIKSNDDKVSSSRNSIMNFFINIFNDVRCFFITSVLVFIIGLSLGSAVSFLTWKKLSNKICKNDEFFCEPNGCMPKLFLCHPSNLTRCFNFLSVEKYCNESLQNFWSDLQKEKPKKNFQLSIKFEKDESGWVYFEKGSTNGSKYLIVNKFLTFQVAQDYCKKLGGHLVHINSIKEQIFVEDYLGQMRQTEPLPQSIGFWLGARRPRGGHPGVCMFDQWKWVDAYGRTHGTIKGFTAFVPGKPDNLYYPEECLYLSFNEGMKENRYLKWDDTMCDLPNSGIQTFCEVELLQQ